MKRSKRDVSIVPLFEILKLVNILFLERVIISPVVLLLHFITFVPCLLFDLWLYFQQVCIKLKGLIPFCGCSFHNCFKKWAYICLSAAVNQAPEKYLFSPTKSCLSHAEGEIDSWFQSWLYFKAIRHHIHDHKVIHWTDKMELESKSFTNFHFTKVKLLLFKKILTLLICKLSS